MKLNAKDYRVPEGKEVKLAKWPTVVEPVYASKRRWCTEAWRTRLASGSSGLRRRHRTADGVGPLRHQACD